MAVPCLFLSPLMFAAAGGDPDEVRALLDAGADANEVRHGRTALHEACDAQCARLLLDAGAQVDARTNPCQITALMRAVSLGETDLARELLAAGADPNAVSAHPRGDDPAHGAVGTPLSIALIDCFWQDGVFDERVSRESQAEAVRLLLHAGAQLPPGLGVCDLSLWGVALSAGEPALQLMAEAGYIFTAEDARVCMELRLMGSLLALEQGAIERTGVLQRASERFARQAAERLPLAEAAALAPNAFPSEPRWLRLESELAAVALALEAHAAASATLCQWRSALLPELEPDAQPGAATCVFVFRAARVGLARERLEAAMSDLRDQMAFQFMASRRSLARIRVSILALHCT